MAQWKPGIKTNPDLTVNAQRNGICKRVDYPIEALFLTWAKENYDIQNRFVVWNYQNKCKEYLNPLRPSVLNIVHLTKIFISI